MLIQNVRQDVSNVLERNRSRLEKQKEFIEVYIDKQSVFVIVYHDAECHDAECRGAVHVYGVRSASFWPFQSFCCQDLKVIHSTGIKVDWMFIKLAQFESNGAPRFFNDHLSQRAPLKRYSNFINYFRKMMREKLLKFVILYNN